jgi:hypothetical protein
MFDSINNGLNMFESIIMDYIFIILIISFQVVKRGYNSIFQCFEL